MILVLFMKVRCLIVILVLFMKVRCLIGKLARCVSIVKWMTYEFGLNYYFIIDKIQLQIHYQKIHSTQQIHKWLYWGDGISCIWHIWKLFLTRPWDHFYFFIILFFLMFLCFWVFCWGSFQNFRSEFFWTNLLERNL